MHRVTTTTVLTPPAPARSATSRCQLGVKNACADFNKLGSRTGSNSVSRTGKGVHQLVQLPGEDSVIYAAYSLGIQRCSVRDANSCADVVKFKFDADRHISMAPAMKNLGATRAVSCSTGSTASAALPCIKSPCCRDSRAHSTAPSNLAPAPAYNSCMCAHCRGRSVRRLRAF